MRPNFVHLILFVMLLLPLALFGDGKVFPLTAYPDVQIPDQRALIHFADGTETLVIETSFVGQGTNFAWVVPVPSVPKIEEDFEYIWYDIDGAPQIVPLSERRRTPKK